MPTLDWIGKQAVVHHHREVPVRLLHCDAERSAGDADAGNLIVQGDNLKALKALLPFYAGKVKCIYIDPPYNTGNEGWIYNDNVNAPEVKAWLGDVVGKEAEDLSRHDKWLCMMYPRLRLLREFLTEDGSIFVSIDDNEVDSLRLMMDEIFGRSKFIATNVWQKRYSRENRGAIGDVHEYLVVYAKDPAKFASTRNRIPLDEKQARVYKNTNDDPRGRWRPIPMNAQGYRPNQMYPIETPSGKIVHPPEGRCWSTIEPEFQKLRDAGRIWFGKKGNASPGIIRYLDEVPGLVPWTWWPHEDVGHTDEAKKEINSLLGSSDGFDTPKPTRLIQRVLQIASEPDSLILDSFAGSGTTMHATMQLNREDGGTRRCILVEMEEKIATEVTSERIRRVMQQEDARTGGSNKSDGFRYCTLGEPLLDGVGNVREDVTFPDLAAHVFFAHTGVPIPQKATDGDPLLGVHAGTAVFLLETGDLLTGDRLDGLATPEGVTTRAVYAEGCRLGEKRLEAAGVTFHQLPYDLSRLHAGAGGGR